MLYQCCEMRYSTRMAKNKYSVEFSGVAVTRTSDRVYRFVTVSLGHTVERETEILQGEISMVRRNLGYYRGKLDKGEFTQWNTREQVERDIQRNADRLARLEAMLADPS